MNELFRDKNGRPVQVGDVLIWMAMVGWVHAPVLRYAPFEDLPALWVRMPHGGDAPLFARDVAQIESEAADVQPE